MPRPLFPLYHSKCFAAVHAAANQTQAQPHRPPQPRAHTRQAGPRPFSPAEYLLRPMQGERAGAPPRYGCCAFTSTSGPRHVSAAEREMPFIFPPQFHQPGYKLAERQAGRAHHAGVTAVRRKKPGMVFISLNTTFPCGVRKGLPVQTHGSPAHDKPSAPLF